MASAIKVIYTGTKLDGESLADWTKQWQRLSKDEQDQLRAEAEKQGATA